MDRSGLPSETISIFDTYSMDEIYDEICEVYLSTQLPWVVGFSGGKDSTATLQIVWYAIQKLPEEQRQIPIYVIASDTLVETPVIVNHLDQTLTQINQIAKDQHMPIEAHKVSPQVTDTFWVNLIGRGYPAPTQRFRWCTDRMKIQPANRFVLDRAAEFGEVVMVLGARKTESASRAQVMSNRANQKITGRALRRHHSLARAYVYTPIEDFITDDVWTYLLQVPSPWGSNNRDLAALYRSANSGECPLVIDDTTPSCGNSRFGCWTCTVVTRDKSMEAMIDNGEEWMLPLLDFRDWLTETQDPEKKLRFRDYKRRNGHITVNKDGKLIPGPYKMEFRKEMLKKLLETQQQVRAEGPNKQETLITEAELHEIRRIWRTEHEDWEDSVPEIYQAVTGKMLNWLDDDIGTFSAQEFSILHEVCEGYDIPTELVARLLEQERQMQGMHRRAGIFQKIDSVLGEEWRDEATIKELYGLTSDSIDED